MMKSTFTKRPKKNVMTLQTSSVGLSINSTEPTMVTLNLCKVFINVSVVLYAGWAGTGQSVQLATTIK